MPTRIPNHALRPEHLPPPDASWSEIASFALTFDGYEANGSFEAAADIANAQRHDSLSDLRTCLFFELRRQRHAWGPPDEELIAYVRGLVEQIRRHLRGDDAAG